jgi:tRNA G10  N-methylase Trm11
MQTDLRLGDCLNVLSQLNSDSVDTIITDPPAGISFMGKGWDSDKGGRDKWIDWLTSVMAECLRVTKPGGSLLCWSMPRTSHWTGMAIENAGWRIIDKIAHIFGSGFPKSLNFKEGKFKGWGTALKPAREDWWLAYKPCEGTFADNAEKYGVAGLNIDGGRIGHSEPVKTTNRQKDTGNSWNNDNCGLRSNPTDIASPNPSGRWPANLLLDEQAAAMLDEMSGTLHSGAIKPGRPAGTTFSIGGELNKRPVHPKDIPADSGGASRFYKNISVDLQDFSTYNSEALFFIRKEIKRCGTIIRNPKVAGMLNGVMETIEKYILGVEQLIYGNNTIGNSPMDAKSIISTLIRQMIELKTCNVLFAENIDYCTAEGEKTIKLLAGLNNEDVKNAENIKHLIIFGNELLELMEDIVSLAQSQNEKNGLRKTENATIPICDNIENSTPFRFAYVAKASRSERNAGLEGMEAKGKIGFNASPREYDGKVHGEVKLQNHHPTVKPIKLMEYLCTLTRTPTGGVVLDPFMGSGTTGVACVNTGRDFIGIEKEADYFEIAKRRIEYAKKEKLF